MLIGIDASRAARALRTGTERYSLELIRHLVRLGDGHRFRLYTDRPLPSGVISSTGKVEERVIPWPRLWTHMRLAWETVRRPPDVLFVPAHVVPLIHPPRCVVTIHDVGYRYYPRAHPLFQRLYLDWSTRHSVRAADAVLADSEATKRDLIEIYGVEAGKVHVVYPGIDEGLAPVRDPGRLESVRRRYGIPRSDYLLFLGTLHPRKNVTRLLEAFARLRREDVSLVLAGAMGWMVEPILARIEVLGIRERVVLAGYVEEGDLPALLSGARLLVVPSLYEGFGFPVLEAMACETPVVCSRVSSLPEVAGDAALLFDPLDVEGMAAAIERGLSDEVLRGELVERGRARVRRFTWRRCAEETLRVLERVGGRA